jgi:multiple antibiotic resistance protein
MGYQDLVEFIVAMIIMMNPLGALSAFLLLTKKSTPTLKQRLALQCGLAIVITMLMTIWIGEGLLQCLGISIASFRFAGGIILLLMGLSMLQSHESAISRTPEDDSAAQEQDSIAVVPMALPIIIGPGAISTMIITTNDFPNTGYKLLLCLVCLLLAATMTSLLYYANTITRIVGASAVKVITRIMGMFIMAIASGMLAAGLQGLLPVLR